MGLRGHVSGTATFELNYEKQSCPSLQNELSVDSWHVEFTIVDRGTFAETSKNREHSQRI